MLNEGFAVVGAGLNFIGGVGYVISTLRGRTQPNRVSWSLWALAGSIAFAAQISQGVGVQSLLTFTAGFIPLLVVLASFVNPKAFWAVSRGDLACGALSVLALSLWGITRSGNVAIVFSIAADALAAIPTLIKAYHHPESENLQTFAFATVGSTLTVLTVRTWTFAVVSFPLYNAVLMTLTTALLLRTYIVPSARRRLRLDSRSVPTAERNLDDAQEETG